MVLNYGLLTNFIHQAKPVILVEVLSLLKSSDTIYLYDQYGYRADRNYNASLNLRDCLTYHIV